jgi:hypothetical protein
MKVLIACEESQTVTKAFRKRGFEAYSCDIQDCSGGHPEWHIKGDAIEQLDKGWDLIIAHPPCTHLAVSGARWFKEGVKPYYNPFVKPTAKLGRHLFWANFEILEIEIKDGLTHNERGSSEKGYFDLRPYKMEHRKDQIIRNCVDPNVGEYILQCAIG